MFELVLFSSEFFFLGEFVLTDILTDSIFFLCSIFCLGFQDLE